MQLYCLGDVAIDHENAPWNPPDGIIPGEEVKCIFNCELPFWININPIARTSGPRILSHPHLVNLISKWAPGFVSLATNHILDAGKEGLAYTITSLNQNGFKTVGAGFSENEIQKPIIWETVEGRLAIVNWVFPETHPEWNVVPGPNCWPGVNEANRIICDLKSEADWVIALLHWSDELFPFPRPKDRTIARELANAGLDILIGHHPHVVRGMEVIYGMPVFYSLGNYYFSDIRDQYGNLLFYQAPRNREALVINITFKRGQAPRFEALSYWQGINETQPDPFHRATRRMRKVSKPLAKQLGDGYSRWYGKRRRIFDHWEYRLNFSLWQKGRSRLFYYPYIFFARFFKNSQ
jgi:hypothetical protein